MLRSWAFLVLLALSAAFLTGCGDDSDPSSGCRQERERMLHAGESGLAVSTAPACADVDYTEQLRISRELADGLRKRG